MIVQVRHMVSLGKTHGFLLAKPGETDIKKVVDVYLQRGHHADWLLKKCEQEPCFLEGEPMDGFFFFHKTMEEMGFSPLPPEEV